MSGLREIEQWIVDEWIFTRTFSVQEEYDAISKDFEQNNRFTLDHILGVDKDRFLQFIDRRQQDEGFSEPEEPQPRPEDTQREPDIIPRIPKERKEKGIIDKVVGFLKRLFR